MLLWFVAIWSALTGRAHAQSGGEARELAYAALRLEFYRDGVTAAPADLAKGFEEACNKGYNPACRRSTWLADGAPDPVRVLEVFEPSCEAQDEVACLVVGWCLDAIASTQSADEKDRSYRRAARQLKADCDSGYTPACHDYAFYLFDQKGVVSEPAPAIRRWNQACDAGEQASCAQLGRLWLTGGGGLTANQATALKFGERACRGGYAAGCALVGEVQDSGWSAAMLDSFYGGLCDQGYRDACWRLSRVYYDGIFPEPTEGRLKGLFARGCDLAHGRSCYESGRWELDHQGELEVAAERFGRACALDDAAGCAAQVDLILSGQVKGDIREAFGAFDLACEVRQSDQACKELALALIDGVQIPRDAERGRALLLRVCTNERSDTEACSALGRSFEEGLGGERDRTEAAKFYRWACAGGDLEACLRRGDLLVSDVGVRRDDHEALNMYQRACDGGLTDGCQAAGRILYVATYVKADLPTAAIYFMKGCDAGDPRACHGLGLVHELGTTGTPNMAAARVSFERAVAGGSLEAKRELARLYWSGYGGKKMRGDAKELCRQACQAGDAVACKGPAFLKEGPTD